ncbi:MFS transporter [Streptomyces sp. C10-9-1]|uniref:MFS transporter n=1 Tax=Streptomyces sp. C10-9-1 TaxID=1859285 RepID=UPI003D761507
MPQNTPAASRGYRTVLRVPEFRAVLTAHLLSLLGIVVAEVALTVLVYQLTRSPLLSALTFALGFLPHLLGGTLGASVADRFPARRVLVGCDLLCAACAAVMVLPGSPVALLLVLRCVMAAVAPVFHGTRTAALADILGGGGAYVLGRSLLRIVSQSTLIAGFGLGGAVLAAVSPRRALCLTAGAFLVSALLLRLGTRARPARAAVAGAVPAGSLAGARLLLGDRRVRALMLMFWVPPLFVVAPEALAAPYADARGFGPEALGLLLGGMAAGHVGAELWAGSRLGPGARSRIVLPCAVAGLVPLVGYAARPGLAVCLVLLVLAGAGGAYLVGLDAWFVAAVPEELRGRAMTLVASGTMTVQGVGMALAGLAAEFADAHLVVAGAGVLGIGCTALLAREVRRSGAGGGRGAAGAAASPAAPTEGRDGADHDMTNR